MKQEKRKTIGVFIDWIKSSYHIELITTLETTAQQLGVNLLTMVGGAIHSPQKFEPPCNIIYDFINKKNVDGILIASGSLGHFCTSSELVNFCKKYYPIPVVSISQSLPGIISVISDNTTGLKDLIQHLIIEHGYKKLGFIKGIKGNQDAEQRFDIFRQTLVEYGIPFDDNFVIPGDFTSAAGRKAVRIILDERKLKPDVIVAANDDMAIGAIKELHERGMNVPLDIAVVGFDDQPPAASMIPPLTTVRQNIGKQGIKALETIIKIINKGKEDILHVIPTEPVFRQSCGCSEGILLSLDTILPDKLKSAQNDRYVKIIEKKEAILTRLSGDIQNIIEHFNLTIKYIEELLVAFLSDIDNSREELFLTTLHKIIYKDMMSTMNGKHWVKIIACLIKAIVTHITKKETLLFIENIFFKAQFLIKTCNEQIQATNKSKIDNQIEIFNGLTEGIMGTVDMKSLMRLLSMAAPYMEIVKCYFAIFTKKDLSLSKLILAYDRNMDTTTRLLRTEFPTNEFIPDQHILNQQRYNLRVHPFLRDGVFLGYTVFEFSPSKDMLTHLLRNMFLSSILKGVFIYETMKTEAKRLEALVNERTLNLKQTELRLIETNKALEIEKQIAVNANKIKSEFLANMSHEIRTPMNSILGFAKILKMFENDLEKKNKLNIIQRSGKHLLDLINDILDFSKIEADKIEFFTLPFSLKSMFDNIRNMFMLEARKKALLFTIHIDTSVPEVVVGDERRLQQIIVNLVGNAIKFTHHGSVVIDCSYSNDKVIISISDTGIGIPEEKHKIVFSSFSQADQTTARVYGGTGLGLTIAKNLVEKMGGNISLKSTPGEGSCFTIKIPLFKIKDKKKISEIQKKDTKEKEVSVLPGTSEDLSDFHILIAEDTPDNQLLFEELLKLLKVNYDIAPDGMQALNKLKERQYDLLLLDMQMPVMDGLETLSRIRTDPKLSNLYIIALTAHSLKGDKEKYLQAGCDDYISKPIDINLFFQKIIKVLQQNKDKKASIPAKKKIKPELKKLDIRVRPKKRINFNKFIKQLEDNCNLFDPRDIYTIARNIEGCLLGEDVEWLKNKIESAADSYDDDLLNWLILYLKGL